MTSSSKDYSDKTDEALVLLARSGDTKAEQSIFERYGNAVRITAASYISSFALSCSFSSLDFDDLFQEGLLGLVSAIYSFHPEKGASFKTYSAKCISNSVGNAVKYTKRKKNTPTGTVVPLSDANTVEVASPEEQVISRESTENIHSFLENELSRLELSVFRCHIEGKSYKEISEYLNISEKSADNALQRIRSKLNGFLNSRS